MLLFEIIALLNRNVNRDQKMDYKLWISSMLLVIPSEQFEILLKPYQVKCNKIVNSNQLT